ncbi:MAG: Cytochrome, partial [Pseudonocardiales bacterium]|nr:Cytochrome [Pseudonocardiales bacterium]
MSAPAIDPAEIDLSEERFGVGVPFETFAKLRAQAPIFWYEPGDCWVVTSYELVERINRDYVTFSSAGGPIPPGDSAHKVLPIMLADDPPVHTMYRRLVNRGWTPRATLEHGDLINNTVRDVLGTFVEKGSGDFVSDVAGPIPFLIIGSIVGVPPEDGPMLWRWTNTLMPSKDPDYRLDAEAPMRARTSLDEYFGQLLETHRREPKDDLTSALLSLTNNGEPLNEKELRDFLALYITGGNETTRHLLSHTVAELLGNDEQRRRFVEGEVSTETAVEEMLRWATPVLHHSRWTTADVELGGQSIKKGQRVTLWMISANHDEAVFEHADQLDLGRSPNPHISFGGGGPHYCLGIHLARLETIVAFNALRPLLPSMRLDGPVDRV